MSYPVAAGTRSLSGTYIPDVWSAKMLIKFYTATVFAAISNTDYEGEIKEKGDEVIIRTVPDITIRDYVEDQKLIREKPEPDTVSLLIDKGKYYSFRYGSVEKAQSDINFIDKWAEDSGMQMKIQIDSDILADVYADAHASNKGATAGAKTSSFDLGASGAPVALTKSNVLEYIVDMGTVLDEQDIPEEQRWLVFPAMFCGMIKKGDLKDASLTGDATSPIRNGKLGMIDRFVIYKSNQIDTTADTEGTAYNCLFGHPTALTFASQLTEQRVIENPDTFGKVMEGLQVYGYETIKTEAMGHFYAIKG